MTAAQSTHAHGPKKAKVSFIEPRADFNGFNLVRLPLMGHLQLGKELTAEEVDLLLAFLNTLTDKTRQAKAE